VGSVKDDILVQSERLAMFPRSGRIVPELSDELVRELIIASYRLIYGIVDDDTVSVLALVHSKRDLPEGLPR
jgi:toxin ParE1/3/4